MNVLSALPALQAALAAVAILARILLLITVRRDRAAHRSGEPDHAVARPSRPTRGLQATLVAMQTVGAVLTIVTWLQSTGLL